jgi:hypothetical protein
MNRFLFRPALAALAALGGLAVAAHAQAPPLPAVAPMGPQPVAPATVAPMGPQPVAPAGGVPSLPLGVQNPRVIQWPGGYMVMNGSEVIVRHATPGGATNLVTGTGNGWGNRIVVGGGAGGVTVVQNARNGWGNQLIVDPADTLIDIDDLLSTLPGMKFAVPAPAAQPKPVNPMIPPADALGAPVPNPAANPAPGNPIVGPAVNPPPGNPASYKGKNSPFWTKKAFSDAYDCNVYWCPTTKLWFRYGSDDDTYRPVPNQPAPPPE